MRAQRTSRGLALWPLAVLAVALAAGAGAGGVLVGVLRLVSGPIEGLEDLGQILLGVLVATVVAAVVWLVGLVGVAHRLLPRGRRARAVVGAVAASVAVAVAVWTSLTAVGRHDLVLAATLLLAAPVASAVFVLSGRGRPAPGRDGRITR